MIMTTTVPEPHTGFPSASRCSRILLHALLTPPVDATEPVEPAIQQEANDHESHNLGGAEDDTV
jgi:hypothetical protein